MTYGPSLSNEKDEFRVPNANLVPMVEHLVQDRSIINERAVLAFKILDSDMTFGVDNAAMTFGKRLIIDRDEISRIPPYRRFRISKCDQLSGNRSRSGDHAGLVTTNSDSRHIQFG